MDVPNDVQCRINAIDTLLFAGLVTTTTMDKDLPNTEAVLQFCLETVFGKIFDYEGRSEENFVLAFPVSKEIAQLGHFTRPVQ